MVSKWKTCFKFQILKHKILMTEEHNPALHGSSLCQQNSSNLSVKSQSLAVEFYFLSKSKTITTHCYNESLLILEGHSIILSNIIHNPTNKVKSLTTPWNVIAKFRDWIMLTNPSKVFICLLCSSFWSSKVMYDIKIGKRRLKELCFFLEPHSENNEMRVNPRWSI